MKLKPTGSTSKTWPAPPPELLDRVSQPESIEGRGIVLADFSKRFLRSAQDIAERPQPKKGFTVTLPFPVARILHQQLQYCEYEGALGMVLGKIDLGMANRSFYFE